MRNICRCAGIAAVAPVLAFAVSAGAASWSPDGARLAYSYIGGPENIYLVHADGSDPTAVLVRERREFRPEWAPDGSHLVFTSVADDAPVLMRIGADGTNLRRIPGIAAGAGDPDYAPDGRRLVYFTDAPLPRNLLVHDLATGENTTLTDTPDFDETSPRWAPDGARIVFVGKTQEEKAESDIWVLDTRTGEKRNLTATPSIGEFHPDWSHDGSCIVYIRVEDGRFAVAIRDVESNREKIVADGNGYAVLDPHFSPDDRYLTFTRTDFAEKGPGMPAIVRLSLDDKSELRIVKGRYLSEIAAD